jgi:hypothetical protein
MHPDPELLVNGAHHPRVAPGRILGPLLLGEIENGLGALVGSLGPPSAWEQARQSGAGEGRLGPVERLAADAKGGGDFGHRAFVHPVAAQHLGCGCSAPAVRRAVVFVSSSGRFRRAICVTIITYSLSGLSRPFIKEASALRT